MVSHKRSVVARLSSFLSRSDEIIRCPCISDLTNEVDRTEYDIFVSVLVFVFVFWMREQRKGKRTDECVGSQGKREKIKNKKFT